MRVCGAIDKRRPLLAGQKEVRSRFGSPYHGLSRGTGQLDTAPRHVCTAVPRDQGRRTNQQVYGYSYRATAVKDFFTIDTINGVRLNEKGDVDAYR